MHTGTLPGFLMEADITRIPEQEPSLTAVPVFIGYVQRLDPALQGVPTYITRYSEYERRFCNGAGHDSHAWDYAGGPESVAAQGPYLRSSIFLYFLNGGGPCFVLPVGTLDGSKPRRKDFADTAEAIDRVPEITLILPTDAILLPAADYAGVCEDYLRLCARSAGRFVIMDAGQAEASTNGGGNIAREFVQSLGSEHLQWGAAYYPYLLLKPRTVQDQLQGSSKSVALPSAAAAAAYSVTDQDRGIWKAPANVPVTGVLGLSQRLEIQEMGQLYSPEDGRAVNLLRALHGRGVYVWGARTLAGLNAQAQHVNVRRLQSFIESTLRNRTMFAVFEPNNMRTWLVIRGIFDTFLKEIWESGGLAGGRKEQAYTIQIGLGETMTQADIDEGRMIAHVQIAPKRPAEFISLRIFHQVQSLGN
ncbi:MAG: phage tail sheath subtilisin-like domain-containing protein [Bacteroidia bacterium]